MIGCPLDRSVRFFEMDRRREQKGQCRLARSNKTLARADKPDAPAMPYDTLEFNKYGY
jgi:hypothetical protein